MKITSKKKATGAIDYTGSRDVIELEAPTITLDGDVASTGVFSGTGAGGMVVKQAASDAGAELGLIHKQIIHTVVGGTITETLADAIPANAFVMGVHGKIKVTVVATTGVSFLLGVTGDTDRFGDFTALTKNTAQTPADHQAEAVGVGRYYDAATDILLTLNAGTFTSGVVTIDIYYADLSPVDDYA